MASGVESQIDTRHPDRTAHSSDRQMQSGLIRIVRQTDTQGLSHRDDAMVAELLLSCAAYRTGMVLAGDAPAENQPDTSSVEAGTHAHRPSRTRSAAAL